ncbi:MAG: aminoglycoside 3-N-acetyltransferase [Devosia sp.]
MTEHVTRRSLAADLRAIGLAPGDAVLVHAALRSIGPIVGGTDMVVAALGDAVGPDGTVLGYTDWEFDEDWTGADVPPFDPARSRSIRDNGWFPEMLRTTPGALRSNSPGASMAALGGRAAWFVADHALDYGYGPQSPLGRLVEARGKVLMLGAPLHTMTLLHHAEHLADIPGKRIKRYETPIVVDGRTVWRRFEEFETSEPVVAGLDEYFFDTIVDDFLATGGGHRGSVGAAPSVLVEARPIVDFAVDWLERRFTPAS